MTDQGTILLGLFLSFRAAIRYNAMPVFKSSSLVAYSIVFWVVVTIQNGWFNKYVFLFCDPSD